jgi:succinate dehydrogenase / fumarate reductase iron-sulfur subunit
MTVLDGLHAIKETQDATLAYRFSCRMAVCGSCGMLINGRPVLACNTQILEVTDRVLAVASMPNFDIVRDLVPDLGSFFEKHKMVESRLQRPDEDELENPTGEYFQSPEQLLNYLQFSYCIRCALCVCACPTVATDDGYIGPMALAQAHRYNADSRDGGFDSRKEIVASRGGVFSCHYAGECSNVCPKGVDPARAIQLLKRDLVFDYLRLRPCREPTPVLGPPEGVERNPDIPDPPPHTVEQDE